MTYEERLELAREFNKRMKAGLETNKISIEKMIMAEELSPEDIEKLIDVYGEYEVGKEYTLGDKFRHENELYEVIIPGKHTSQEDWVPGSGSTEALYKRITPGNVIADFIQPTATTPYLRGAVVKFEGEIYECIADSTVYSPRDYAPHWKKI